MARNRYDEIITKSAGLFREHGYTSTSIRDIGRELGVTSAALYYHFRNKEELLLGIMHQGLQILKEQVQEAVRREHSPWGRIRAAIRTHLEVSLEYQDFAIVLLQELRHLGPESLELIINERDEYEAFWSNLLDDAKREGQVRPDVDLHLLRLMTFGSINLVVTWYRKDGQYTPSEICDNYLRYISDGVMEISA